MALSLKRKSRMFQLCPSSRSSARAPPIRGTTRIPSSAICTTSAGRGRPRRSCARTGWSSTATTRCTSAATSPSWSTAGTGSTCVSIPTLHFTPAPKITSPIFLIFQAQIANFSLKFGYENSVAILYF